MPLIRPEVQNVLRQAGLAPEKIQKSESEKTSLSEKLDAAALSVPEILEELSHLAHNSTNEALRHRALETALKAHGALKESAPSLPSFTIVIQTDSLSSPNSLEQSTESKPDLNGINPILVPRQLLNSINNDTSKKETIQ